MQCNSCDATAGCMHAVCSRNLHRNPSFHWCRSTKKRNLYASQTNQLMHLHGRTAGDCSATAGSNNSTAADAADGATHGHPLCGTGCHLHFCGSRGWGWLVVGDGDKLERAEEVKVPGGLNVACVHHQREHGQEGHSCGPHWLQDTSRHNSWRTTGGGSCGKQQTAEVAK